MSGVTYHISQFEIHMSSVTIQVSPVINATTAPATDHRPTATATDPPPANSTTINSRLVHKYPKTGRRKNLMC